MGKDLVARKGRGTGHFWLCVAGWGRIWSREEEGGLDILALCVEVLLEVILDVF